MASPTGRAGHQTAPSATVSSPHARVSAERWYRLDASLITGRTVSGRSSQRRGQTRASFLGPEHWGRLAIRLLKEGQVTEGRTELDEAIELFGGTVEAYPQEHRFWPGDMSNLSLALRMPLFALTRDPHQLGQAVELLTQAADRSPFPSVRLDALSDPSSVLLSRFQETGSQQDLDHAVYSGEESVKEAGTGDPRRSGRLYTWGRVLCAT
ncbi:hypothetical protein [Streptomyces atratus]|uniref:hypothetical protein n=1 Tax=Streptomyces atratus TaxID=1893 RepID=UPI003405CF82